MSSIRVVTLMEANYAHWGSAKNFLRFSTFARSQEGPQCDMSVVTFVRSDAASEPPSNDFIDMARASGLHVDVILEHHRFDRSVIGQLRRLLRERAPDLIETHGVKSHFLVRLTRPENARWLAYHHGYTNEDFKVRLYNKLNRWTLLSADRVVTVCKPFADMLAETGVRGERIDIVPSAIEPGYSVDSTQVTQVRAQWHLLEHTRIILSVGRLSREKGHRDLITAASILRENHPDLVFVVLLIGDGPERRRLEQQAQALGLCDRVRFTGYQQNLMTYYTLSDIFVLPSYSEGSPNVLLEAMIAGTPIVASAVGGVPETVEHERSALLVEPGKPAELAQAIARILTDHSLATSISENASHDVRQRHSPDAYNASMLKIYCEVLPAKAARLRNLKQ
jgi:glycosyltransferase involved in cell wall biosynthesis